VRDYEAIAQLTSAMKPGFRRNGTGGETPGGQVQDWLKTSRRGDARAARHRTERDERLGVLTWATVIADATAQVLAEDEPVKLREELAVLAATALAWIEAIDRGEARDPI
jgi:hypothetical protein